MDLGHLESGERVGDVYVDRLEWVMNGGWGLREGEVFEQCLQRRDGLA